MSGNKSARQSAAQTAGAQASATEQKNAAQLQTDLQARSDVLGQGLGDMQQKTQQTATDLATTGGFTPEQEQQFIRQGTEGTSAVYANEQDQLERNKSLQGGYSPGFDSSTQKLTRDAANATSTAGLNATVGLHQLEQSGKIAGQDALQRYVSYGAAALSQDDTLQLQNRLQSGQMTMADAQLLSTLAAQDKTLFDQITQGIGAVGGLLTGVGTAVHG